MGRPLGPGGRVEFLNALRYWKKNNKSMGRVMHRIRCGDTILAYDQEVEEKQSVVNITLESYDLYIGA